MGGLFGIGIYQPITGGTTVGTGFPLNPLSINSPYAGIYGGTYGYILDTTIRAPKQVQYQPAPSIGVDPLGNPIVRSFPQMFWSYSTLRPDYWYYLRQLYRLAGYAPAGFQYLVLIQYPDRSGANTPVQQLARWDPPTHAPRQVGAFYGVQLKFTYLGQAILNSNTPIVTIG